MSFLKRLFGARTPADRMAEGERLLAGGELGLARLEFEAAAAAADASDPGLQPRAQARLREVSETLARARLEEARAYAEAGEATAAEDALAAARGLGAEPQAVAEIERLARSAAVDDFAPPRPRFREPFPAAGPGAAVASAGPAFADLELNEAEESGDGDEPLTPLEQSLMSFPEPEAARLRALVAVDRRLAEGLIAAADEKWIDAARWYGQLREPAASDPLVRREAGRAALADRRPGEALVALEDARRGLPADPETLELLMEARLAGGDVRGAAAIASEILAVGLPRDIASLVPVLFEGGHGEEALRQIDRALGKKPHERRLWELRAALCERMGSPEGVREADAQVIEAWSAECQSCSGPMPEFPLASARRLAGDPGGAPSGVAQRKQAADLLRLLVAHDEQDRARWKARLAELER